MRTLIKTLALSLTAFLVFATGVAAQKISAAAVVDQHYATQTSNYKLMMIALAIVYVVYTLLNLRRKRQLNRIMGKI